MKIKIILLLAMIIVNNKILADDRSELSQAWLASRPTVILPSPQSALFEQYTKHDVSEVNGLPQITIPLYTIKIKGLEIPVSLSYHASGIKFRQFDGDVGAGWSLSAGGYRVSRTVNGVTDELFSKVQMSEYDIHKEITDENREAANDFFRAFAGNLMEIFRDAEYDMFTYMLPTTNGHFVLLPSREIAILEPNLDKVTAGNIPDYYGAKYGYSNWSITDGSGFKYHMGCPEGSEAYIEKNQNNKGGKSSVGWTLKQIESPYKQKIDFSYTKSEKIISPNNIGLSTMSICEAQGVFDPSGGSSPGMTTIKTTAGYDSYSDYNNSMLFIQEIKTDNETVTFERGATTDTIPYLLKKITVKDRNGNIVKTVKLNYDMPTDSCRHTLLKSVVVSGGIGSPSEDSKNYAFNYYLPPIISTSQYPFPDYYGYYNYGSSEGGAGGNYIDYTNSYFDKQLLNKKVLMSVNGAGQADSDTLGSLSDPFLARWYDRTRTKEEVPQSYTLKSIIYPTGGRAEYEYESNEIGGTYTGGLRVKKISSFAGNDNGADIVTQYKYKNGVSNINTLISHDHFIDQYFSALYYSSETIPKEWVEINRNLQVLSNPYLSELNDYKTSYKTVEVTQHSGTIPNDTLGKTILEYQIPQEYHLDYFANSLFFYAYYTYPVQTIFNEIYRNSQEYGTLFVNKYSYGYSPVLVAKQIFNKENRLLQKESYSYQKKTHQTIKGVKTKRKIVFPAYADQKYNPTKLVRSQFDHRTYTIEGGSYLLSEKTVTEYSQSNSLSVTEYYTYNNYNQLYMIDIVSEADGPLSKEYTYPWANNGMKAANIVSPVIRTITRRAADIIGEVKTNYPTVAINGMFLPQSVETRSTGNLRTDLTYDKYDTQGNLLQYTGIDGVPVTYLWGYGRSYPIAEIKNATYDNVVVVLGSALIERLATSIVPATSDLQQIDNLRLLSGGVWDKAQVSTYTYRPLVGVLSETPPSGQTTYYTYDDMGRLKESYIIEGGRKKLLQYNQYNYKNQ